MSVIPCRSGGPIRTPNSAEAVKLNRVARVVGTARSKRSPPTTTPTLGETVRSPRNRAVSPAGLKPSPKLDPDGKSRPELSVCGRTQRLAFGQLSPVPRALRYGVESIATGMRSTMNSNVGAPARRGGGPTGRTKRTASSPKFISGEAPSRPQRGELEASPPQTSTARRAPRSAAAVSADCCATSGNAAVVTASINDAPTRISLGMRGVPRTHRSSRRGRRPITSW